MQVTLLFTVYDSAAEFYLPPFFVPSVGIATRAFADAINSDDHQFGKHPDQYTLYRLGTFNDQDASFDLTGPRSLGNGVEFLLQPNSGDPHGPHESTIPDDQNSGDSA